MATGSISVSGGDRRFATGRAFACEQDPLYCLRPRVLISLPPYPLLPRKERSCLSMTFWAGLLLEWGASCLVERKRRSSFWLRPAPKGPIRCPDYEFVLLQKQKKGLRQCHARGREVSWVRRPGSARDQWSNCPSHSTAPNLGLNMSNGGDGVVCEIRWANPSRPTGGDVYSLNSQVEVVPPTIPSLVLSQHIVL